MHASAIPWVPTRGLTARLICAVAEGLLTPFGRARRHLRHYLAGSGASLGVSTAQFLREDAGLRAALGEALSRTCAEAGTVAVPQWRLRSAAWRLALGSLQLRWQREGDALWVGFEDRYDWHPKALRITRVFHWAAACMKGQGARAFTIHGFRERVPVPQDARLRPSLDRLYL